MCAEKLGAYEARVEDGELSNKQCVLQENPRFMLFGIEQSWNLEDLRDGLHLCKFMVTPEVVIAVND
jgi:hypothetical protein